MSLSTPQDPEVLLSPELGNSSKFSGPTNLRTTLRLMALLGSLEILWAPVNFFVVIARQGGLSPAGIGLIRWFGICSGLFLALSMPWFRSKTKAKMPSFRQALQCLIIGVLITGPSHLMYYASLGHTETVQGTVFNATSPLWMAFFAGWLLDETVGLVRWLALVIGGIGAYFASVGFAVPSFHQGHLGWNVIYLAGTLLECLGGALLARIIRKSSGIGAFAWETLGRGVAMIVFPLLLPEALPMSIHFTAPGTIAMVYLIFVAGLFTFGAWVIVVERAPLSLMVVTIALQTPVAAVLGHYFLGEKLSTGLIFGAVLIFIGLGLAAKDSSNQPLDESLVPSEAAAH